MGMDSRTVNQTIIHQYTLAFTLLYEVVSFILSPTWRRDSKVRDAKCRTMGARWVRRDLNPHVPHGTGDFRATTAFAALSVRGLDYTLAVGARP